MRPAIIKLLAFDLRPIGEKLCDLKCKTAGLSAKIPVLFRVLTVLHAPEPQTGKVLLFCGKIELECKGKVGSEGRGYFDIQGMIQALGLSVFPGQNPAPSLPIAEFPVGFLWIRS